MAVKWLIISVLHLAKSGNNAESMCLVQSTFRVPNALIATAEKTEIAAEEITNSGTKLLVPTLAGERQPESPIDTMWDDLLRQQEIRRSSNSLLATVSAVDNDLLDAGHDVSRAAPATVERAKGKPLLIAYLSGVKNHERRSKVRESCFPAIIEAGFQPMFFIGLPSSAAVNSEPIATDDEQSWAQDLKNESEAHDDIYLLPFRDEYRHLSLKVIGIMDFALAQYQSVLKIDDDMCPNLTRVAALLSTVQASDAFYAGKLLWDGSAGADDSTAPYLDGSCYFVSAALAQAIFQTDRAHTLLFDTYGSMYEDANMGKWFVHSQRKLTDHLTYSKAIHSDLCSQRA